MDLAALQALYSQVSAKASDVVRNLGFAGIAVVWVFSGAKVAAPPGLVVPQALLIAAIFFILGLALDLVHHAYRTAAFGIFNWHKERIGEVVDIEIPRPMLWPMSILFWGKSATVVIGYVYIGIYLVDQL